MSSVIGKPRPNIQDNLSDVETDEDTRASVLRCCAGTPPGEAREMISQLESRDWWHGGAPWRDEQPGLSISSFSPLTADTGNSCGSDADRVPTVFTPVTPGSSCGSHLTSISQVLQRSNSSVGALGEVLTSTHNKRKYNTTKNGKRNSIDALGQRNVKRRLLVAPDELSKVLASECCSGNCLREHLVFSDLSDIRKSVEGLDYQQRNRVVMLCISTGETRHTGWSSRVPSTHWQISVLECGCIGLRHQYSYFSDADCECEERFIHNPEDAKDTPNQRLEDVRHPLPEKIC